MSVKIRLRRMGAKKRPIYRLVVIDSRRARQGRFIDHVGHYIPIEKPAKVVVDQEKVFKWLKEGAEPSDTVKSLFTQIGLNEKWLLIQQGKDASGIEIKTSITERKKRRKKVKEVAISEETGKEEKAEEKESKVEENETKTEEKQSE